MANLLVMMEFHRGALLPVALETLGQARRLGSALGLTVYAVVPLPPETAENDEDITVRCGRFGADKVLLLTGDSLFVEKEMRFEPFAEALSAAWTMLPPRLFLMGETPAARDIAPRLAARLGAAFVPRGAALAVDGRLVLCDATGRHLRIPAESAGAEGMPPLMVPVVVTLPVGRHEMAWGDQDAELLIVEASDESAQTIPNLSGSRLERGGFTEEAIEPVPLGERIAACGEAAAHTAAATQWQLLLGSPATAQPAVWTPWSARLTTAEEAAPELLPNNYQLVLPNEDLAAAATRLAELLRSPEKVKPITAPGQTPPILPEFEGFDDSNELTPTAESWDYGGDTMAGDEASSARIRSLVTDASWLPTPSYTPSANTPPVRIVSAPVPGSRPLMPTPPPTGGVNAGMWAGDSQDRIIPVSPSSEWDDDVNADTAPVPIVAPAKPLPKEGK